MENLGKRAKDKITGFTGVIIGKIIYLTGCNQYGIVPPISSDGRLSETQWFDVRRIEVSGEVVISKDEVTEPTNPGGPNRDQPR